MSRMCSLADKARLDYCQQWYEVRFARLRNFVKTLPEDVQRAYREELEKLNTCPRIPHLRRVPRQPCAKRGVKRTVWFLTWPCEHVLPFPGRRPRKPPLQGRKGFSGGRLHRR